MTKRQKYMKKYNAAYMPAYRDAHKEEIAAQVAAYHASHKEEIAAYMAVYSAAYYATHKEEKATYAAAYRATHKEEMSLRDAWRSMLDRCENPKNKDYKYYGGANPPVTVCKRWHTFELWLKDMGPRPISHSNGRRGDVGNYKPGNAYWQTKEEQQEAKRIKRATNN